MSGVRVRHIRACLAGHGNISVAASIWVGLTSLAAMAVRPLCGALPKGGDTLLHLYRIAQMNALWERGIFFSRWAPDLMLGFGYPLFQFYPPLSAYLLTALYWLVGQDASVAMAALMGVSLLAACLGMFLLGDKLYGATGGLFAAAAYTLSPYLLYQVYERSSISDALAMALFPWATWALIRVATEPTARRAAWAAILLAAVCLSHVAAAVVFVAPLALVGLSVAWGGERRWSLVRARVLAVLLAFLGGLGLAAFFWIPASMEINLTRYDAAISASDVRFHRHFASLWSWPGRVVAGSSNPDLPIATGAAQLALGALALLLALGWLARQRSRSSRFRTELLTAVATIAGLSLVFLATPASARLWEHSGLLRMLQWPWRCLDGASFLLALACGSLARGIRLDRAGRVLACGRALLLGAGCVVFVANAAPYMAPPRYKSLPAQPTLADVHAAERRLGIYGLTSWGEYAPATAKLPPTGDAHGTTLDAKLQRDDLPAGALLALSGGPLWARASLYLASPVTLTWDTFFFPGWHARIDGQAAALAADEQGLLSLEVAAGEHVVEVAYGRTPLRALADALSLGTAALLVLALISRWRFLPEVARPRSGDRPSGAVLLLLSGLLLALLALKLVWLDRGDSPLIRYLHEGRIAGVEPPGAGDFGGEIRLIGYEMEGPGVVALYWQAQRAPSADYATEVTIYDALGVPLKTISHDHPGDNLVSRWEVGQLVRDEFDLGLDDLARPGGYRLAVAVTDPLSGEPLPLLDAPEGEARQAAIGTIKLAPEAVAPGGDMREVGVTFGGVIRLVSAGLPATAEADAALELSLLWESVRDAATDYTVFVHLLAADGTLAGTADGQPHGGLYPTSFWSAGETILDVRQWQPELPPGEYQVAVGLYELSTGYRLPISDPASLPADHIILGTIRITA